MSEFNFTEGVENTQCCTGRKKSSGFRVNDPHPPTSSIFHCYPLPIHHPFSPSLIIHLPRAFQKCIICQFLSTELKVMPSYIFSIVITFQIWTCHVTCVDKLSKIFISSDTLLNFRKSHQI